MRIHKLTITFAMAVMAAAAIAVAGPAHATAGCIVELGSIYADDVGERDGADELRVDVDGHLYPRIGKKWNAMSAGDTGDAAQFEDPSVILDVDHSTVMFRLKEVTPPAVGAGDSLGEVPVSYAADCSGLLPGTYAERAATVSGVDETSYSYLVRVKLTRF